MNESIIRRFARYHGVELVVHEDAVHWALEEIAIALHGSVAPYCVLKVAQSITHIEDAEMLIAEVGAVTSVSDGPAFPRVRARLDILANELLVQAGIKDPHRWREVKE